MKLPSVTKIARVKKDLPPTTSNAPLNVQSSAAVSSMITFLPRSDEIVPSIIVVPAPCSMDMSPSKSDCVSVLLGEKMSTCDSFRSSEVEYVDKNDVPTFDFINQKTLSNLYISDGPETKGVFLNKISFDV